MILPLQANTPLLLKRSSFQIKWIRSNTRGPPSKTRGLPKDLMLFCNNFWGLKHSRSRRSVASSAAIEFITLDWRRQPAWRRRRIARRRRDGSRVKWSQNWGNSSVLRMREFLLLVPRHQPVPPLCRRDAGCRCRMCVSLLALSWVTVTDKTKAFVAWLASAFFNVKKDWKIFKVMSSICLCAVTLSFWAIPPVRPLGPLSGPPVLMGTEGLSFTKVFLLHL